MEFSFFFDFRLRCGHNSIYVGNDNDKHAIRQRVMAGIVKSGTIPSEAVSESLFVASVSPLVFDCCMRKNDIALDVFCPLSPSIESKKSPNPP